MSKGTKSSSIELNVMLRNSSRIIEIVCIGVIDGRNGIRCMGHQNLVGVAMVGRPVAQSKTITRRSEKLFTPLEMKILTYTLKNGRCVLWDRSSLSAKTEPSKLRTGGSPTNLQERKNNQMKIPTRNGNFRWEVKNSKTDRNSNKVKDYE